MPQVEWMPCAKSKASLTCLLSQNCPNASNETFLKRINVRNQLEYAWYFRPQPNALLCPSPPYRGYTA